MNALQSFGIFFILFAIYAQGKGESQNVTDALAGVALGFSIIGGILRSVEQLAEQARRKE